MANPTLTEQMGAMALIDELRHQKMAVQEHLNLPARRVEVANRIAEYYKSKGIEVQDEMIEQGVKDYFSRRLLFNAPDIKAFPALLARIYIARSRWIKPAAIFLFSVVSVIVVLFLTLKAGSAANVAFFQKSIAEEITKQKGLLIEADRLRDQADLLRKRLASLPVPAAERILNKVSNELLPQATKKLQNEFPAKVSEASLAADKEIYFRNADEVYYANQILKQCTDKLASAGSIIDIAVKLEGMTQGDTFLNGRKFYTALETAEDDARRAIAEADTAGVKAAEGATERLASLLGDISRFQTYISEQNNMAARFNSMKLNAEEKKQIDRLMAAATSAIKRLDTDAVKEAQAELSRTLSYAETPLTINILNTAGSKSGVERKYNASGGKSWYLVVEAIDPAGENVEVPVISSETKIRKWASVFAVRVTREEYERVKRDKLNDGHVDNKLIGKKRANSLTIQYGSRTSAKPDMILEW